MTPEAMTVVVPVKNRATLVLRTLASIKAQTWRPIKVIVVDNGSVDGTPESVSAWIEKNREEGFDVSLESQPVPGASRARNVGLEAVDTRLMMFFDSDDIMQPGHVESVMRRFQQPDQPDLVYFRVKYHPINGEERITKRPGRDLMVTHICHSLFRTQGCAYETALARRAGGWNEELRGWDDLEFGTRVMLEARNRAYIKDVNVDVYARIDSITGTEFSSSRGEWEAALDAMEEALSRSRHKNREKWLRTLSLKRAVLGALYRKEGNAEAAEVLYKRALANPLLNAFQCFYIKAAFRYTAFGGRGAASPANLIFNS